MSKYQDMLKLTEHDLNHLYEGYILATAISENGTGINETFLTVIPEKTRGTRGTLHCKDEYNNSLVITGLLLKFGDFYYITEENYPEYFI